MSVNGVLWRFALAYVAALIAAGYILSYLGFERGNGINVGILAGCVLWVCMAFGKANRRYFTSSEKVAVIVGLLVIDLALQFLVTLAAVSAKPSGPNSAALLFALVFVGILHAIGIYVFVGIAGKTLAKQDISG